jgi:phage/plasmid-associated DNA primase
VLLNAFGDYKETIQSEFFVTDTRENTERQKAKLMGTRLVVSNEIDPSHIIDVARIKEITSTTELDGRKLYQEAQTFKPSHTILVTANDFLRIPEKSKQDQALLSRLILIPTAQESIRDTSDDIKQYGAVLWRNCSAVIMDWIIQGAVKFNAAGGRMPQPSEPMRKYREKVLDTTGDVLDDFLKMCTVCTDPKEGKYIFSKDFVDFLIQFADYRGETDRNKIKTPNALNKAMTDRGYTIKRKSAGNAIENISWLDPNTGELK